MFLLENAENRKMFLAENAENRKLLLVVGGFIHCILCLIFMRLSCCTTRHVIVVQYDFLSNF